MAPTHSEQLQCMIWFVALEERQNILWSKTRSAQGHALAALPLFVLAAISYTIFLVHHLIQECQVISVEWCHGDVPHGTELTTVVQVLVLQTEEVPHKPPGLRKRENYQFVSIFTLPLFGEAPRYHWLFSLIKVLLGTCWEYSETAAPATTSCQLSRATPLTGSLIVLMMTALVWTAWRHQALQAKATSTN